jgi:putative addiction module component (TIGR02574 family)
MDPQQLQYEINQLTIAQKLILAQDIWDSIAREGDQLLLPEWQTQELERRYRQYQQGELKLHDWQEVHAELRGKQR